MAMNELATAAAINFFMTDLSLVHAKKARNEFG